MAQIAHSLIELIGNTPLVELAGTERELKLNARIIAKLEYFNPARSVKDRTAKALIEQAERNGQLNPDTVIIEPTSGNTGIGLAFIAAIRGYRLILTMPDSMSVERRTLLKSLGAQIVLTPSYAGMAGAIRKAQELLALQVASIHNLAFYLWLVGEARQHIIAGDFAIWKAKMVEELGRRL